MTGLGGFNAKQGFLHEQQSDKNEFWAQRIYITITKSTLLSSIMLLSVNTQFTFAMFNFFLYWGVEHLTDFNFTFTNIPQDVKITSLVELNLCWWSNNPIFEDRDPVLH